jgi:hypothetical protein
MIQAIFVLFLLVLPEKVHARCDPGGGLNWYMNKIMDEYHDPISPLPSCCLSACTMRLVIPKACVYPDTILGFHSARDGNGDMSALGNNIMMKSYHRYPKLQAHIRRYGYFNSLEFKHLSGVELNRMGVPYCSSIKGRQ